jgi:GNAT superfamily N-acetyltransferase
VTKRYQIRRFTPDLADGAAELLAERHRRHRQAVRALDPAYEDPARCVPLIAERLEQGEALGAVAFSEGTPVGYVLTAPRDQTWGPNAWAEDCGNAGEAEAVREAYAAIAGDLVEAGRKGHWAMVPPSETDLVEAWFSLSFGLQQVYAFREPIGADLQPSARDGLVVRRAVAADIPALAELDMVLPNHTHGSPVFSTLKLPSIEESAAELVDDINNPKYNFWVAEHDGRVISTLVGVSVAESTSWTPMMRPVSAALLGYAATMPDARGLGAGRALTETFMAWARDEGYEWLATDWRSTNLEANRTWRAMGFRPGFYRLHRQIA